MKRIYIILGISVLVSLFCDGQNNRIRNLIRIQKEESVDSVIQNPNVRLVSTDIEIDTAREQKYTLYRNVMRQYTWLVGQGAPISQEEANHLPVYFRLSMKNEQGNYQYIEAMHGDTLTTNHNVSPYFVDKNRDGEYVDRDWFVGIGRIAKWFIISDNSGSKVVEERAYTKDGDMVYGFIPVLNDSNHVTGSYNDSWGRPADFNEVEDNVYGSVVSITYDAVGRDSIVDYLDGKGYRKLNPNGIDQERFKYDSKNRLIMRTSHNFVGDYMIDNWGNCGNKYEYAEDGKSYTITRIDQYLRPMRMPEGRSLGDETFIRCRVNLDEWGREKERIFLNEKGEPDMTLSNIHRIEYEYDEHGVLTARKYYDIKGQQLKSE